MGSPSFDFSVATAINDHGQIVGEVLHGADTHAFVWSARTGMYDLGYSGYYQATGINNAGQVAGTSNFPPYGERAFIWNSSSGMQELGGVPANFSSSSVAWGINNAGQVTGGIYSNGRVRATIWSATGEATNLGDLPGGADFSYAFALNDAGQVVGWSSGTSGDNAFIWREGVGMTDLGNLRPGRDSSMANSINANGEVVGSSFNSMQSKAFLWTEGLGMMDLGDLPGGRDSSTARGINDFGLIVGSGTTDDGTRAFVWSAEGGMRDLNTLLDFDDPLRGRAILTNANDINNSGQIVGSALIDGQMRAILLSPVPEPESYVMLLAGLGFMTYWRRRRIEPAH